MKKAFLILLAVSGTFLVLRGQSITLVSDLNLTEYHDSTHGFSILEPEGWQHRPAFTPNTLFKSKLQTESGTFGMLNVVRTSFDGPAEEVNDQFLAKLERQMKSMPGYSVQAKGIKTIRDAKVPWFKGRMNYPETIMLTYYYVIEQHVYTISYGADPGFYKKTGVKGKEMCESFRVFE